MPSKLFNDGCGIDFGTTNSVVAISEKSNYSQPLLHDDKPHPSVVWMRLDGTINVGQEAKSNINSFSDVSGNFFISSIKRHLGKNKNFHIFGQRRTAVDITSEIFKFLISDAKNNHQKTIKEGIVTIPVNFDGKARRELRQAADRAGFYIKTFVHEPFAALVGYCFGHDSTHRLDQLEGGKILVFDWGGGTLDITIASLKNGSLTELSTSGLGDRAGDNFDSKILDLSRSRFIDHNRLSPLDCVLSSNVKDRYLTRCEIAKIKLSDDSEARLQVAQAFRIQEQTFNVNESITRSDFESLIEVDVKEATNQIDHALKSAGLTSNEIDLALIIGGTSNIPLIKREMEERFGHRLVEVSNPDTIIAEGAAIIDALELHPVFAKSVGIQLSDESYYEVFPAGIIAKSATVPKQINMFCTDNRDGQARLVIKERKSNNSNEEEKTLATLPIPVSHNLRPHFPERVTVTFSLDEDLVLQIAGIGATKAESTSLELYNLCFGLRTQ